MPRRFALLAVLSTLAIAGCGGGGGSASTAQETAMSPGQYRSEVTRISSQFAEAGRSFRDAVGPSTTPQQAAAALQLFQDKVRRAAVALDALTPPRDVASAHRQLTATFRDIAQATQPSIDAGRSGDRQALTSALQRLRSRLAGSLGRQARAAATRIDSGLANG